MVSTTEKIRVLVIDDHGSLREGIAAVVNAQPDMVIAGEASNGREAIEQYRGLQPDVTLLDWNLPVLRGEEVITTLISEFPRARFIVMSALSGDDSIQR
jgi:two-component system, NarL family, response regulator